MEFGEMLQDSKERSQSSVFGFDAYPGQNSVLSYCPNNAESNIFSPPLPTGQPNSIPSFIPSQMYSLTSTQIPSHFSFGSPTDSSSRQFPYQITFSDKKNTLHFGKRKLDSPPLRPCKQLITEEKMAEHMSNLHISSESAMSPIEPESVKNKRLYMCEEMRKLQSEPVLPPSLLSKIHGPCTALVLWQPPPRAGPSINNQSNTEEEEVANGSNNNNNNNNNSASDILSRDNQFGSSMDMDP